MGNNILYNCEFKSYDCCLECIDCYEECECKGYGRNSCNNNRFSNTCDCFLCCSLLKCGGLLLIMSMRIVFLILIFLSNYHSELSKINQFILTPVFSLFYSFFLIQFSIWNRDTLLFAISGVISFIFNFLLISYEDENSFNDTAIVILIIECVLFGLLFIIIVCPKYRSIEDKKQKYLRWYSICYFIFCVFSNIIYAIATKNCYPENYNKNNQNAINSKGYISFLLIGLAINITVGEKKRKFSLYYFYIIS